MPRSRFQAPRVLTDFVGVLRALREVQESLDDISRGRAELAMNLRSFNLMAGNFQRASAPAAGMQARLPKASGENLGDAVTLHLEGMLGQLDVFAAPGDTVNGQSLASYTEDGVVVLWSNGVNAWSSVAQLPTNSSGGAALDAEYVLGAAHASLSNGRVATDSTEVDAVLSSPGLISWTLNLSSVAFSKLVDLAGLSVLGRSANSTGVMAAITSTAARQVLRNNDAGTALAWGFPIEFQDNTPTDLGDVHTIRVGSTTSIIASPSFAAGVGTVAYQRGALSGAITAIQGSNSTLFDTAASGAGLTGGGTAVLAVGAGTHITVNANDVAVNLATLVPAIDSTSVVANGTVLERAALTGHVTAPQNSNTLTIANDVVTPRMLLPGVLTLGAGTHNDVALTDAIDTVLITGNATITGFAGGWNGRAIDVVCAGGLTLTLAHVTGSLAGNQITCPDGVDYVQLRGGARLRYDTSVATDIWRVAGTATPGSDTAANSIKANPNATSGPWQDLAIASNALPLRTLGADLASVTVGSGEFVCAAEDGATSLGLNSYSKENALRTLLNAGDIRWFDEDFQGNLAATEARFSYPSGFATRSLAAVANSAFLGALALENNGAAGTTRGVMTLGTSEVARNFHFASWRYFRVRIRGGANFTTANTGFQVGLVGTSGFAGYGAASNGLGSTSVGLFFEYRTDASSGAWTCGKRIASTTSVVTSGVAAANNTVVILEMYRQASGAVHYYVNGAFVTSDATAGVTGLSDSCTFYLTLIGSTAATRNVQIDQLRIVSDT